MDDLLLTWSNEESLKVFNIELMKLFEMIDLGILSTYLGIQVIQKKREIIFNQRAFAKKLLKDQQMMDNNPSISLMSIMWPASQSHFHFLFIFIEMNFVYYHSYVMFAMKSMNICND